MYRYYLSLCISTVCVILHSVILSCKRSDLRLLLLKRLPARPSLFLSPIHSSSWLSACTHTQLLGSMLKLALGGSVCRRDQCWWEEAKSCSQQCSQWSDRTAHTDPRPQRIVGLVWMKTSGSSCRRSRTRRAWGGFSRLTGAKTTVRSSTWQPNAPGWSMTEVSRDFDPRADLSKSVTVLSVFRGPLFRWSTAGVSACWTFLNILILNCNISSYRLFTAL